MTSPHDVSLYELALSSEQPSQSLQISPTIFKSMISMTIDLLLEQNISATLWLKLPRGPAWQSEIDRYRATATAPHSIYWLNSQREEKAPDKTLEEEAYTAPAESLIDAGLIEVDVAETQLRREYLLLVLSSEFNCLLLTHRPRSTRPKPDLMDSQELLSTQGTKTDVPIEEEERKNTLVGLCAFDPHTIERVLRGLEQAIDPGSAMDASQAEAKAALSQYNPAQTTLNPLLLSHFFSKQIQRYEEVWRSSTLYRKQAEVVSSLQLENEELLNAVQMKDEFLKNVGQELRTPLTSMKTALSLLNSSTIKPPQRQRYMEMLSRECDRQSALITSVLDLVQLENVTDQTSMQPLRLGDIVPGVVSTYQPLASEKGIMLAYTIPEDLPAVSCLNPWLRQIVINLLHNGIKFTPTGGQVWVKAKRQGDFVEIEFRDTGIGIAATEIPKVFDRFYRVRPSVTEDSGGTGLGLSIVQQLLWRCGGSISVKSRLAEGSVFSVMLPIY
jgi:two-component system, OmpR family, phosphate regulon sensor histidine kinase PhoR